MASTKYYDGIHALQAEVKPGDPLPAFDMERMRKMSFGARIAQWVLENPRWLLGLARRFKPIVKLGPFILVTRASDVRDVLERQEEFETPFGPEMAETTGSVAVLLGLQDGALYRRQKSAVLTAFPPAEAETRVRDISARHARAIMATAQPGFDVVNDLLKVVPARICSEYYGLAIDDERAFTEWSIALSTLYFGDYLGDRVTRELALAAAEHMAATVDRSIEIAIEAVSGGAPADKPLHRLVKRHLAAPDDLTKMDIRALMIGMVSGFVPTDILASSNALDVVLSKPEAQAAMQKAIADKDDAAMDRALMEAMRFKPINIGPVRYVNTDATIAANTPRAYKVKKGSTLWVSTLAAMFDDAEVREPETYNPDRPPRDYAMVFGHGIHWCIGSAIARVQIAECFKALFAKTNVRRARGKAGRLARLGPFPEHLSVWFDRAREEYIEKHVLVTAVSPIAAGTDPAALRDGIAALQNPARADIAAAFRRADAIHFCSVAVVGLADPMEERKDDPAQLVFEISGDGRQSYIIDAFAEVMEPHLRPLLETACGLKRDESLAAFLNRHALRVGSRLSSQMGAVFSGTPGHSVKRIRAEAALEREVAGIIAEIQDQHLPPVETVREVRRRLPGTEFGWALDPARSLLEEQPKSLWEATRRFRTDPVAVTVAILIVAAAAVANYIWLFGHAPGFFRNLWVGTLCVFLAPLDLLTMLFLAGIGPYLLLRREEKNDAVNERVVGLDRYEAFASRENATIDGRPVMQNNLTAISIIKPGWLRPVLLRVVFAVVAFAGSYVFRPGYLADINTIHFARWVRLPGTRKLMFFSNYGGSWESYLEDFITKAHQGLTGVWSNTLGFPRARNLFFDGATDGDRFKRWARMQQIPTLFWYSAYPDLNTRRIRTNSAIRQGLTSVESESAAREWLTLFGSLPRPVKMLENDDIQGIFFGPYGDLQHGRLLAVSIPAGIPRASRLEWLTAIENRITYGDRKPEDTAVIAALGPKGLESLEFGSEPGEARLAEFPLAFRQGMDADMRARLLDDVGANAPSGWRWGTGENAADVVIVAYARTKTLLDKQVRDLKATTAKAGLRLVAEIALNVTLDTFGRVEEDAVGVEPFGFADGISQPVVEGTPRARRPEERMHMVAAGEFLFGYPDGRGRLPPSVTVPADSDPDGRLSEIDGADGRRRRDFGRNGSFLVVRQLEQHVERFETFCAGAAKALAAHRPDIGADAEWIGARMVGRWKDGSSLIRNPHHKPGKAVDNDFHYGEEDPQGLACPLGAHVRRANPRDSLGTDRATQLTLANRHRILRVGRPYREGKESGLVFMCLNADIERQFEFVQQTWVAAGSFHGLRSEKDPLIGYNEGGEFTVATIGGGVSIGGLKPFVTTRGGGYFFLPSRRALAYLKSRLAPALPA
jgi:Dyp-type peroxidase family